jgi:hypothetical protein
MRKPELEIWKPIKFLDLTLGTAFSVSVFDQKKSFWLELLLEPINKKLILKFPHRHSIIFYSVSFADKINYVLCQEKANGGIYFVKNSKLYKSIGLDYDNQYIDSTHFVIPSVDLTIEILARDNPIAIIDDKEFIVKLDV